MFKKIISLAMMFVLAGSTVGCTSGTKTTTPEVEATASETKTTEGETTDTKSTVKWPKNVEIVVPAGAGGDTDFNARVLAENLTEKLGTTFVVSNVSGNGGVTGTRQVKDADNDGSKILFYHSAFSVNQLSGASDYGFEAYEFAGIAAMNPGNALTVSSSLGVNSLEELVAYSKANPGKLKMAAQTGATSQAVALLLKAAGLDVNIVDAGSAADRLVALLGGHVDIILAPYGAVKDYVSEGNLIALALDGESDLEVANLKSVKNLGYDAGFPFYYFFAFPKGTDQALVQEFTNALKEIIEEDKDYAEKIQKAYYQAPVYFSPEEGLKKFEEVYSTLGKVDFTQTVN